MFRFRFAGVLRFFAISFSYSTGLPAVTFCPCAAAAGVHVIVMVELVAVRTVQMVWLIPVLLEARLVVVAAIVTDGLVAVGAERDPFLVPALRTMVRVDNLLLNFQHDDLLGPTPDNFSIAELDTFVN
jgi:hypothetical protein